MKIILTDSFKKKYKVLSAVEQKLFKEKLNLLLSYWLEHPSLRIHKLNWKLNFVFSLSINMNFRALFYKTKENNELVLEFFSIWNHDIYKKMY